MKYRSSVILALIAGFAIGAISTQALHAKVKPPVYSVGIIQISNKNAYHKEFGPLARKSIKAHGGAFVAAGPATPLDGNMPKGRMVILRFDSMEALYAWRKAPDREAAWKVGRKFAKFNVVAVPGVKTH